MKRKAPPPLRSSLDLRLALRTGAVLVVSLTIVGCSGPPVSTLPATGAAPQTVATESRVTPLSARAMAVTPLCPIAGIGPDIVTCNSVLRSDITANPNPVVWLSSLPGYHPNDLRAAYGVTEAAETAGAGQTVAVVVAYHNPLLGLDLDVYRAEFGLPSCTESNGCLTVTTQTGTPLNLSPAWAAESDLDVQMVSAICPNCRIIVSEARSAQIADLASATGAAVAAGATVVSNSYTTTEDPTSLAYDHFYDVPGVPMTAGSGDAGYGAGYPASSRHVTAVGGTTLHMSGGRVTSESVWSSSGGGCSAIVAKPPWQAGLPCPMRATNDLAVVADPATGVSAFMTVFGGWNILGGTSIGAPIVASLYALAGNGAQTKGPGQLYAHPHAFRAVAGTAGGYDDFAGLGAPVGTRAF